jgi:hypothetical protein
MLYDDDEFLCPVTSKMRSMLKGAQTRARDNGREFDLDLDHLFQLYIEVCPILGIDILWENSGRVRHGSPSLDRVDNKQGYIKGNVQIISHRANSLKKDYLLVEWKRMEMYMSLCEGKPLEIVDDYFKEYEELSEEVYRDIRVNLKKNKSLVEMSEEMELSAGVLIKAIRKLNKGE